MEVINIIKATVESDFESAKNLIEDYASTLHFDLGYQNFQDELQTMSHQYGPPQGALLLAILKNGIVAGCVGIRRFSDRSGELKRLYVHPDYRNMKIGKSLLEAAVSHARQLGYQFLRLDTVAGQEKAQDLYRYMGFYEIKPYRYSPVIGTIYFEKDLGDIQVGAGRE